MSAADSYPGHPTLMQHLSRSPVRDRWTSWSDCAAITKKPKATGCTPCHCSHGYKGSAQISPEAAEWRNNTTKVIRVQEVTHKAMSKAWSNAESGCTRWSMYIHTISRPYRPKNDRSCFAPTPMHATLETNADARNDYTCLCLPVDTKQTPSFLAPQLNAQHP